MTRPRLILHIGTHKTGTTAIQRALDQQRAECLARGVFYPPTDREPWPDLPKHCSVFAAAARGNAAESEAERQWLLAQFRASGAHTLLISEEGLSEPLPHLPEFFAPMAAEFDIVVVCMLRRPDLFTESLYNQFVREAARREGRPVLMFSRAKGLRERLRYAEILHRWKSLPARVVALDFDATIRDQALVAAFANAAGLPPLAAVDDRANASADVRLIQLLSRMNRQRLAYDLPRLMQAAAALESEGRFARCKHLLGRQERVLLLEDMAPEMARLSRDFGVSFSGVLPPGESTSPAEDIDVAYTVELLARVA